jgi:hypothetical protein
MSFKRIRRIPAALMAVVLAVGLATHGLALGAVAQSDVTAATNMAMPADMPMQGKCDGCAGDEKGVAPAACFAFCCAVNPTPLLGVVPNTTAAETLAPAAGKIIMGRVDPPDPYPPRPISMS